MHGGGGGGGGTPGPVPQETVSALAGSKLALFDDSLPFWLRRAIILFKFIEGAVELAAFSIIGLSFGLSVAGSGLPDILAWSLAIIEANPPPPPGAAAPGFAAAGLKLVGPELWRGVNFGNTFFGASSFFGWFNVIFGSGFFNSSGLLGLNSGFFNSNGLGY